MKRLLNQLFLVSLLGVFMFSSCKKDNNDPDPTNTIVDIVVSSPDFTILEAAILRVPGLATTLSTGTLTVFAPTDAAFAAAGLDLAAINALDVDALEGILTYHVLGSIVKSTEVPASDAVATVNGAQLYVSNNTNGVFANGIGVTTADVLADNGVIHIITSGILIPPTQTIAEILSANPDYSLLVTAVVTAGLLDAVSNPGNLTVFSPDNDAFAAVGFSTPESITAGGSTVFNPIVSDHVLSTNVFASDLSNGLTVANIAGNNLVISLPPAAVKKESSSNAPSNITGANIVATNGVIHYIDAVIL